MFTRDKLGMTVEMMLIAFQIPREAVTDFTIECLNRGDAHGVWDDFHKLAREHDPNYHVGQNGHESAGMYFLKSRHRLAFALNLSQAIAEAKEARHEAMLE